MDAQINKMISKVVGDNKDVIFLSKVNLVFISSLPFIAVLKNFIS